MAVGRAGRGRGDWIGTAKRGGGQVSPLSPLATRRPTMMLLFESRTKAFFLFFVGSYSGEKGCVYSI